MPYHDDDDAGFAPDEISNLPRAERDYIVPASDVKGNNIRLQCRTMPAVGRMLSDLLLSRTLPFRTQGDIIRFCIVDGVRRLLREQKIDSVVMAEEAMRNMLVEEQYQIEFREYFVRLRAVVDHYLEANAPGEARRVVSMARQKINDMPEGYWRERHTAELLDKYGKLLDAEGEGVAFTMDTEESPVI